MKKIFFAGFLVVLAASLLISSPVLAEEKITMWARTPETLDILRDCAISFMEENPGTEIEVVDFPADDYPGALQAAITGDNLPDIFHTHSSVPVPRLEELGKIQPIGPYFSEGFIEQFDEAAWFEGSTTLGGEIYAWPDRTSRRASLFMYYNKDVMKDAGLDPEAPPANWDELIQQGQQVNQETGLFGLHLGFTSSWFNERVILQFATTVAEDTGVPSEHFENRFINWKKGDMFDYESIFPVMDFFKEMEEAGAIHPNYITAGRSEAAAQWASGQAAFLIDGSWRLQEIILDYQEEYDLDFGIAMLPGKELDVAYWGVEGGSPNSFVVSESSENVELAVEFFEYLTKEYYPVLIQRAMDLTPVPAINEDEANYVYPKFRELVELTNQGTKTLPAPQRESIDELQTITNLAGMRSSEPLGPTLQGYLAGERIDLEEYLKRYSDEQQEFLERALEEAKAEGADVSMDNWIYEDWDKSEDYVH